MLSLDKHYDHLSELELDSVEQFPGSGGTIAVTESGSGTAVGGAVGGAGGGRALAI